jgi:hypothetical protein
MIARRQIRAHARLIHRGLQCATTSSVESRHAHTVRRVYRRMPFACLTVEGLVGSLSRLYLLLVLLLASPLTFAERIYGWSFGSDTDIYVLSSPDAQSDSGSMRHLNIPIALGDEVFVHASGCVDNGGTWVPYLGSGGVAPQALIWIPGNVETGGAVPNGTPLSSVVDKALKVSTATSGAQTIAIGFASATSPTYTYAPGSINTPECQQSPHAELTVAVHHSEGAIRNALISIPTSALTYRFDTWPRHRFDLNGLEVNPIFNGQIEACQVLSVISEIFGGPPVPLTGCFAAGFPDAEQSCNGFPLLSTRSNDLAPPLFSNSDEFANLIVTRLLKDVWAWNHNGEDLTCPSLIVNAARAICDGNDPGPDNRDHCAACYFQPWQWQYYTSHYFNHDGNQYILSDSQLKDDILNLNDLLGSKSFSALSFEAKLAKISPIVWNWWPIIDARWRFTNIKGTRTSSSGTEVNTCRSSPLVADTSSLCALGHVFYYKGNASGAIDGLGGHVDFQPATYSGRMWIEAHSSPSPSFGGFGDDDINWGLRPTYGEGSAGGEKWLHVERSSFSSLRKILAVNPAGTDFWTGLARAVDKDNSAWINFNAASIPGSTLHPDEQIIAYLEQHLPAGERTSVINEAEISKRKILRFDANGLQIEDSEPYPMPAADLATVIGNLGLDCYHGCSPELHPAYLIAIRTKPGVYRERWSFLADPQSDEGFCSNHPHSLNTSNRQIKFFIPHQGATQATVHAKSLVEIHGRATGTDIHTGQTTTSNFVFAKDDNSHISSQLIPGQGVVITLDLWPRPSDNPDETTTDAFDIGWIEGDLDVVWSLNPLMLTHLSTDSAMEGLRRVMTERLLPRPPWVRGDPGPAVERLLEAAHAEPSRVDSASMERVKRLAALNQKHEVKDEANDEPEVEVSTMLGSFLASLKSKSPAEFQSYMSDLQKLQTIALQKDGVRQVKTECRPPTRLEVVQGGPSGSEERGIPTRTEIRKGDSAGAPFGHAFGGTGAESALKLACGRFGSRADFPLRGVCAGASGFASPSRNALNTARPQVATDQRICPADDLASESCLLFRPGSQLELSRVGRFGFRVAPSSLCSSSRPGDVVQIETRAGPVVGVTLQDRGAFVMEAADNAIEALFRGGQTARIERLSDGRLRQATQ